MPIDTSTPKQTAAPDPAAILKRSQAAWAGGDFSYIAARIVLVSELLCESADLQAGWRTLDVATGSGNCALAAARRGCVAVGVDFVPALLERGRIRADAERLAVEFREADAENLPFPDASFDAVTSVFGVMFAPNHQKAAAEMLRVCKPGGRICLAAWTPDGYSAESIRLMSRHQPPRADAVPPSKWGEEGYLKGLFGQAVRSIQSTDRINVMRFVSPEAQIEFFRTHFGPAIAAFEAVGAEGAKQLQADMAALSRKYDRNKAAAGPIAIPSQYLETVIVRA
jgi:ubiquinone/menaquinone biosynthesis C-methylase UbiE